ncbi:hypothetical protein ACS0TY_004432 [Phlomoides rotata]
MCHRSIDQDDLIINLSGKGLTDRFGGGVRKRRRFDSAKEFCHRARSHQRTIGDQVNLMTWTYAANRSASKPLLSNQGGLKASTWFSANTSLYSDHKYMFDHIEHDEDSFHRTRSDDP